MKFLYLLRRISLILLSALIIAMIGMTALITWDALFGEKADRYTNVTFTAADGTQVGAYLVKPPGEGKHPAVLMIHEWWGVNKNILKLAERLSAEGYVVLVPDTYRGQTTELVPRALFIRLTLDQARVDQDVQAAYNYLAALPEVDPERIGGVGFCYGGGVILRHGTRNDQLAALVTLYGSTITDPQGFGELAVGNTPVLAIFGDIDPAFSLEEITAFGEAMETVGIPHDVLIYPGVGHAFVQASAIDQGGSAQEAWLDVLAFLQASL